MSGQQPRNSPLENKPIPVGERNQYGAFIQTPNMKDDKNQFTFQENNKEGSDNDAKIPEVIGEPNDGGPSEHDAEERRLLKDQNENPTGYQANDIGKTDPNVLGFSTDVKDLGEEKIIDLEKAPETTPRQPFNQVLYIFFQYYWQLGILILFSVMIIRYYKADINNFKDLALALLIANGVKIILNFIWYTITRKKDPDMNKVYFWNTLSAFSFLVLYLGGFLFFNGNVSRLYYFSIHNIVIHFVIWVGSGSAAKIYVSNRSYHFVEAIQILFICIKLGNPSSLKSWNTTTIYYFVILIVGLVLGAICGITAIVMFILGIFKRQINANTRIMFFVFFAVCATMCWMAVLMFLIFLGFRNLLNDGVVTPAKVAYLGLDRLLYNTSIALLVLSSFYMLVLTLASILLRTFVRDNYSNDQIQRLGMVSFAKEMQLGIKQMSGTYYQANNLEGGEVNGPIELGNDEKQECILCYSNPNEVIIKPCGHSGYCKGCMISYLQSKNVCPMCKLNIDSMLIFYYDEERRGFFSKEAIRVANVNKK